MNCACGRPISPGAAAQGYKECPTCETVNKLVGAIFAPKHPKELGRLVRKAVVPGKNGLIPIAGSEIISYIIQGNSDAVATELDLNSAPERELTREAKNIYIYCQWYMAQHADKFPPTLMVFRGGPVKAEALTPVTLDLNKAALFASFEAGKGVLGQYTVRRDKVMAYIPVLFNLAGYDEDELLVYGRDLKPFKMRQLTDKEMEFIRGDQTFPGRF